MKKYIIIGVLYLQSKIYHFTESLFNPLFYERISGTINGKNRKKLIKTSRLKGWP